jgi:hypothetical protein
MNCTCLRCGYEWWPRKNPDDIVSCARCKSRAWRVAPAPPSEEVESLEQQNKREVEEKAQAAYHALTGDFDATPGGRCS